MITHKRVTAYILCFIVAIAFSLPVQADEMPNESNAVFSDVPITAAYSAAIKDVNIKGLMSGVGNDCFEPDSVLSQAQLATILYRFAGSPQENMDIASDSTWYTTAATWAYQSGYMTRDGDSAFQASRSVTREEIAVVLWNYIIKNESRFKLNEPAQLQNINDSAAISLEAQEAVLNLLGTNVMGLLDDHNFGPQEVVTRADAAVIFSCYSTISYYPSFNNFDIYQNAAMTIKSESLSSSGATVVIENFLSDKEFTYGVGYALEREFEGEWFSVPRILYSTDSGMAITLLAYHVYPQKTSEQSISWKTSYGDIEAGHYRIVKYFTVREADSIDYTTILDEFCLSAEFEIA